MSENNENMNPIDPEQPSVPQQPQEPQQPAVAQPGYSASQPDMGQPAVPPQGYMSPQPGMGQVPQPGYPQGYSAPAPEPSPILLSIKTIPTVFGHMWHGRTSELFATISQQRLFGLVTLGMYTLCTAILGATSLARSTFGPLSLGDYIGMPDIWFERYSYFSLNFGQWFYALILFLIISMVAISLRAVAIILTLKMRGINIQFMRALTLYTVAVVPTLMFLPVMLVIILLPVTGFSLFLSLVATIMIVIAGVVGELLLYVGINREGRMSKSPALPYACLTVVWLVISFILNVLIMTSF